jgi:hypothetical protein
MLQNFLNVILHGRVEDVYLMIQISGVNFSKR